MSTPLWNSTALAFQLPEGVALPSWWQHAEALGWSHETCASAAQLTAPRSRRVYGEGDRFEVTRVAGEVTEVSAEYLGGTVPEWDPVGETWVDRPWRWAHPSTPRPSQGGDAETLAALLWRRSRELSRAARRAA